jgi:RNA polymerase sigma factor (TIGR02999 family)
MRRILVEIARRKNRRRDLVVEMGPVVEQITADGAARQLDLIALDEALDELAHADPRKAKLIELRFFAGLSEAETAECLGISRATAERDWAFARAWLFRQLNQDRFS